MNRLAQSCLGKTHKMEKLLEVSLLLLLAKESAHGYALMEHLSQLGFESWEINVGSLYRTLRKMEEEQFVVSHWEHGGGGPRRRVYRITENGEQELMCWIAILKNRKVRIERVIALYGDLMDTEKQE